MLLVSPGVATPDVSMIQFSSAGKHFGSKILFEGLDWLVTSGERVGLVGGNGTGKSTLLATLIPAIERTDQRTVLVALHDGQRRLPLELRADPRLHPPVVIVVDGYEQLSRWSRMVLMW